MSEPATSSRVASIESQPAGRFITRSGGGKNVVVRPEFSQAAKVACVAHTYNIFCMLPQQQYNQNQIFKLKNAPDSLRLMIVSSKIPVKPKNIPNPVNGKGIAILRTD